MILFPHKESNQKLRDDIETKENINNLKIETDGKNIIEITSNDNCIRQSSNTAANSIIHESNTDSISIKEENNGD